MKKFVLAIMIFLVSGSLLAASDKSSLFLVSDVPLLTEIGFYASAEGALQTGNIWMMGDSEGNTNNTTAYLIVKTNTKSIINISVNLPVMKGQDAIVGHSLEYSTAITKEESTAVVTIESGLDKLKNSNGIDDADFIKIGTIKAGNISSKGIYKFVFSVSTDDFWSAYQGTYRADVTARITGS